MGFEYKMTNDKWIAEDDLAYGLHLLHEFINSTIEDKLLDESQHDEIKHAYDLVCSYVHEFSNMVQECQNERSAK